MDEWPDKRLERQTPCEWLDRAVLELGADVVRPLLAGKNPREELELIRRDEEPGRAFTANQCARCAGSARSSGGWR